MNTLFWTVAITWRAAVAGFFLVFCSLWLSVSTFRRHGSRRSIALLEAFRLIIVALLVLTLFQPELVRETKEVRRPGVTVLCDMSGSMETVDVVTNHAAAVSRREWLEAARQARVWAPLEEKYDVFFEDFSAPTTGDDPEEQVGTDINAALEQAMQRSDMLRAIVLLSDGDWNEGRAPVFAATRLGMRNTPVCAVAVGSDRYLPDLELQDVRAPAYGLIDEHVSLPFAVQSRLRRDVNTTVTIRNSSGIVASKSIVVPALARVQETIFLVPRTEGEFEFTMDLPTEPDEALPDNNTRKFVMSLRRELLKALIVESQPRWEYRFLRNALVRDPGVKMNCLLIHPEIGAGSGTDYLALFPANREELSQYDVVFLGDVGIGEGELTSEQAELLKELVQQQGSGLVFLPGRRGRQASLLSSALSDLLPVTLDESQEGGFGFGVESQLVLTTRGRDHLLTLLASDPAANQAVWNSLPGFNWHSQVIKAKPGADVLAVHSSTRNQYGRLPLLVTEDAGNGKVLFMGTDSAWRWRRGVEDTYHYRFWGQVVRWMAHKRHLAHTEGIRFFYSPESPKRGDTVFLHATVFDETGYPLGAGTVDATITDADGRSDRIRLDPEPGGWGVFTGSFVPRSGGTCDVALECPEAGRRLQTRINVESPKKEVTGRPARFDVLREITATTQGRFGEVAELDEIIRSVALLGEMSPKEERLKLWCHPAWGALIVLLLGVYWVGRKLIGLI